jgi:hypothetical protein
MAHYMELEKHIILDLFNETSNEIIEFTCVKLLRLSREIRYRITAAAELGATLKVITNKGVKISQALRYEIKKGAVTIEQSLDYL